MSSWITLNVDGITPDALPDAFDDWCAYEKDGVTVVYSFNPNMSPVEAASEVVKVGEPRGPVSAVNTVIALRANDTSDFVEATLYRPREVKWQGVKAGVTWHGHHSPGRDDSQFLECTPDGITPVLGGNWTEEIE